MMYINALGIVSCMCVAAFPAHQMPSACATQEDCQGEDMEVLIQKRVNLHTSNEDTSGCTERTGIFEIVEEDGPTVETDADVDDSIEYAMLDDTVVKYYIKYTEAIESLRTGDNVTLCLQEILAPTMGHQGPWVAEGVPFHEAVSSTLIQSAEDIAVERRKEFGMEQPEAGQPKVMDVLVVVIDFKDKKVQYGSGDTFAFIKKSIYAPTNSFSDMLEAASYGRMIVKKPTVVKVTADVNWMDYTKCTYRDWIKMAEPLVVAQTGIDPKKFTFREFFIPSENPPAFSCGWVGIANVGCGHPSRLPNPGACYAVYRRGGPFVRGHELGHNLGLLHGGGERHGKYKEYGDHEAIMGNGNKFCGFIAAARYQMGFLRLGHQEVIDWDPTMNAAFTLASISLRRLNQPGANGVAIRMPCKLCVPKVSLHKRHVGGYLWVQFRDDDGYSKNIDAVFKNKVMVHLARIYHNPYYGAGTELWKVLKENEGYKPDGQDYTIFVCNIRGDFATVAIGLGTSQALANCGSSWSTTTTTLINVGSNDKKWCGFEGTAEPWCGLWYSAKAKIKWQQNSGKTPSSSTGPSKASEGSNYLFIETSSPVRQGDNAILSTRVPITIGSGAYLKFDAHMYGKTIGALNVFAGSTKVWAKQGNKAMGDRSKADKWVTYTVSLQQVEGQSVTISFEGIRGRLSYGDIGLDNVELYTGGASGPATPAPRPTTPEPEPEPTTETPTTRAPRPTTPEPEPEPTTQAPPITTMPPPPTVAPPTGIDMHKKLDAIEKKFDAIIRIMKDLAR